MIRKYSVDFQRYALVYFHYRRLRRQTLLNSIKLRVEIRYNPPAVLPTSGTGTSSNISDINTDIINRYQCQNLQETFANVTGVTPQSLSVQEPQNQTTVTLGVVSRLVLVTPPSSCRLNSPCDVQPVLVAYDTLGNVINKLGSNNQPWQVVATVISPVGVIPIGAIANYTNGQTQYTSFGLPVLGSVQVEFRFLTPSGVSP